MKGDTKMEHKNNFDREYEKEYAAAKKCCEDLRLRGNDAVGEDAAEFMDSLLSPEEIAESDLRVALIGEMIKARKDKGISQKRLEEISGVKQPVIARMEKGQTVPQISTLIKLLVPLGKTLAVVPLDPAILHAKQ